MDAESSCLPQPATQPEPPIAHAPKPTRVMCISVRPRRCNGIGEAASGIADGPVVLNSPRSSRGRRRHASCLMFVELRDVAPSGRLSLATAPTDSVTLAGQAFERLG